MPTTDGHSTDSSTAYALPPVLNLRAAQQLKSDLLMLLRGAGAVAVDANAVARLSTPAVQVLTAFVRDLEGQGRSVEFTRPSGAFRDGFRILGLSHIAEKGFTQS